jgi:hypothetical protein
LELERFYHATLRTGLPVESARPYWTPLMLYGDCRY